MDPIIPLQNLLANPKYSALEPDKKVEAIRNWEQDTIDKRNASGDWDMESKAIFDVESTQARQAALGIEPMSPQAILESLAANEEEDRKTASLFEALSEVEAAEREKREINALKFRTIGDDSYLDRNLEVADGKIRAAARSTEKGFSDIEDARMANEVIQNKRDSHVVRGKLVVKPDLYYDREAFVETVKESSATPREKARVLAEFTRSRENLSKAVMPDFQRLTSFRNFAKEFAAANPDTTNGDVIEAFKKSGNGDWEKTYNAMSRGLLSGVEGVGYAGVLGGDLLKKMGMEKAGTGLQNLAIDGPAGLAETAAAKQSASRDIETAGGLNTGQKLAEVGAQLGTQIFATMVSGGVSAVPGAIIQQGAKKAAKTAASNVTVRTLAPEAAKKIMATGAARKLNVDEFMKVLHTNVAAFAVPAASSGGPKFYESYERHRTDLASRGLVGEELEEAARTNALTDATRHAIITGTVTRIFGLNGVEGIGRLTQIAANPTARASLGKAIEDFTIKVGKGSIGEGFEEALDEGINGALDALLENPDMTFAEWEEQVLFAGFAGAIFGAGVRAPSAFIESAADVAKAQIANSPEMVARNAKAAELREQGMDDVADALEQNTVAVEADAVSAALDEIEVDVTGKIDRIAQIDTELQAESAGMSQGKIQELRTERETLLASMEQGTDPTTYNPEAVANQATAELVAGGMDPAEARTKVVATVNKQFTETPVTPDVLARAAMDTVADIEVTSAPPRTTKIDTFSDPDTFYRVIVGDEAFNDILESGSVRTNADNKPKEEGKISLGNRPTSSPSFSKGKVAIDYAKNNPNHYVVVTTDPSIKPSTQGRHGKGTTMFPTDPETGKSLKSLGSEKVSVYQHTGEGNYRLVLHQGKPPVTPESVAERAAAESEVTTSEPAAPVEPVTPVKAEPTFRSILGRPATVEGESGDIRIDPDGVVVLDRGPSVPPIEISRNPDDVLSSSDLEVSLDEEAEADVAQAGQARATLGTPLPDPATPIAPATPARAPRAAKNFNVREDGAVVTMVPGGEGQIRGVSDFVASGFTEDTNEFFVTVKPRNGKPDFDIIGDDAIAIAETLRRNAASRPVTPASQATETVPEEAQEDLQLTAAITAAVPEPVLAFDRILTRLILDKPTLNAALIPGKSKLTKEDLDVALSELTTFQTQVENENFPADIKARLDAIVDESLDDLTRLSRRAKPAPAPRETPTPDDARGEAAGVPAEPAADTTAGEVTEEEIIQDTVDNSPAPVEGGGMEIKDYATGDPNTPFYWENDSWKVDMSRVPAGAEIAETSDGPSMYVRDDAGRVAIYGVTANGAHTFVMYSENSYLPSEYSGVPLSELFREAKGKGGRTYESDRPSDLFPSIPQKTANALVNQFPPDNSSNSPGDVGPTPPTPTIQDRITDLENRADGIDSARADNQNWLFTNGKKKTTTAKEEAALRQAEVSRAQNELETIGDELDALRETNQAAESQEPVFVEPVERYNIPLPEGYVKQGELYIYQPGDAEPDPPAPAPTAADFAPDVTPLDASPVMPKGKAPAVAITPADTVYMELAKDPEANRAELQRMVDEAAGNRTKLYRSEEIDVQDTGGVIYYSEDPTYAAIYMGDDRVTKTAFAPTDLFDVRLPDDATRMQTWLAKEVSDLESRYNNGESISGNALRDAKRLLNESDIQSLYRASANVWLADRITYKVVGSVEKKMMSDLGLDAIVVPEYARNLGEEFSVAFRDSSVIESADPVTYDTQGNIIPLSKRFNPNSDSILEASPATTNFDSTTPWSDVVTSLIDRAIQKYPNIPIKADATSTSLARTQGLDMTINPVMMAESTAGMGPAEAAQIIDKIVIHEATHRAALTDLDPEFPTQYAAQMTVDEKLDTARGYLHRSAYATDEAYNTAVRQFAGVEGTTDARTVNFKLGHEALRMLSERMRTGYTTEETIAFLKMNPNLLQRAIRYLKAYVNRLKAWATTRKDPSLYAEMDTLNKAVWEMENGPHVDRGVEPFTLPGRAAAPAPAPRMVYNSVLGREIAVAASPVNRDPAVMRHGELEAKHNAGTITPEETAEAQALVDEAAKAAGGIEAFHGGNLRGDVIDVDTDQRRGISEERRPGTFYGSTNQTVARTYQGKTNRMFFFLKNPFSISTPTMRPASYSGITGVVSGGKVTPKKTTLSIGEAIDRAKQFGYDGVIFGNTVDSGGNRVNLKPIPTGQELIGNTLVAFASNQIKSADPFTGVPLDERFNPESDSILEASPFGNPARVPIRHNPEPGKYKEGGWLTAAFRWDPRVFEMLQKSRNRYQSLIKEAEFFHKDLNAQLSDHFSPGNKAVKAARLLAGNPDRSKWPTDTVNLALGNTDNRMTEADVEAIKKIKSQGLAAAQGDYLRARALAKQQDDAGMIADAALTRQDARAAFDSAIAAYKDRARTYEDNARIQARVRAEADRDAAINSLPDDIQETVRKMRLSIDALSRELIRSGAIPDDLRATIDANQGLWLHRSYRIFDQENYAEWIQESKDPEAEQLRNKTLTFVRDDLLRKEADKQMAKNPGMTRAQAMINAATVVTHEDVMKSFNGFLHVADGGVKSLLAGATISKDVDALMKRGVIPKEIQELWGVYTDPTVNAAKSLGAVAQFVTQQQFLTNLVDLGTSEGWLSKDQFDAQGNRLHELAPNNGMSGRYNGSPSTQWAPLSGYYGPRALADAISDSAKDVGQGAIMKTLMQLTGYSMAAKTVLSWQSVMRNFWGNILFTVANGNATSWNAWKSANKSRQAAWSNFYGNGTEATRARVKRLIELGVFGDAMTENLIRDLTNGFESDKKAITFFDKMAQKTFISKVTGGAGKVFKTSARFYSLPDEFWKVVAFEGELGRVEKYMPNATPQQQEEEAARIVKATMPTYSQAPEIVQLLRRNPFIAPFITFTTEVYRTSVNTVKLAAGQITEGIKTDNKELLYDGLHRTLGIMLASAGVYGVTLLLRSMAGFDAEDEDDLRNHVPVWDENSTLMILPTDRTDGKIDYMNISYMNPYDVWSRPFRALVRGLRDPDSGILETSKETLQELFDPVLSEQIFAGSILDVARGVTLSGKEIYDKTDSDADKITQSLQHIFKQSLMPGTLSSAERIVKASQGYVAPGSGRSYDKWNEIFSGTLGMKFSSIDTSSTLQFSAKQFKANRSDSIYTFSKPFKSNGTQSDEDIADAYIKANAKLKRSQLELYKKMTSAVRLGTMTQREALRQMKADGVTDEMITDIAMNRFRRYEPSTRDLNEAKKKGDKLGQDRIAIYRAVREEVPRVEKLSEEDL